MLPILSLVSLEQPKEVSQPHPTCGCSHRLCQCDGEEGWPSSWGDHTGLTSPSQSQCKVCHPKCQNPVHPVISWGDLEAGIQHIQLLLVNSDLLVEKLKCSVWWWWHKNTAFTTHHMVWNKKDFTAMFWQQCFLGGFITGSVAFLMTKAYRWMCMK